MSGIADAKQPWKVPPAKPVNLHREETDLIPVLQFADTVAQERCNSRNRIPKRFHSKAFRLLERAFRNDQPGLKIIAAVDEDESLAKVDIPGQLLGIAPSSRDTKPQHIDGDSELLHRKPGGAPYGRMPPVARDH